MGIIFLDGKEVLYTTDTAMRFSSASFWTLFVEIYGQSVEGIWLAYAQTRC